MIVYHLDNLDEHYMDAEAYAYSAGIKIYSYTQYQNAQLYHGFPKRNDVFCRTVPFSELWHFMTNCVNICHLDRLLLSDNTLFVITIYIL